MKRASGYLNSPVGWLEMVADANYLYALNFVEEQGAENSRNEVLKETEKQLKEYFEGRRSEFDLPLKPEGTEFQQRVWQALLKIPFGETASYKDIAEMIGKPKAMRAVGLANGRNPIPIIIPCHRVIGADGKLIGYSSGLWRKEWLLNHEKKGQSRNA
ncbi:MAG: methylated-DNA--[protein]-cysteine S-methyltransferase [Calditrichaeota bacterium]|nr:methylated-DNA--[protein]-cysteine S-methyltransferase [Calditrichota bacterium]